ncbi:MAG: lysophospholipid acyltransferase family protein [Pseudomonadota bacterium]
MTIAEPGPAARFAYRLYGLFALSVFAVGVLACLAAVSVTPGQARRRRIVAAIIRATFIVSGANPSVSGLDNLPPGPSVVVANHASYLDGLLLKGFLPPRFSFVIKGEMRRNPLVHFLLRRSGARFVERSGGGSAAKDVREFVRAAKEGAALGFFPEGTFVEEPGVMDFRPGAFLAAIKAELPVVPIGIRGTRHMLPANRLLPWPAPLAFEVLPAILPGDPAYRSSKTLAEAARARILPVAGEPDCAPQTQGC